MPSTFITLSSQIIGEPVTGVWCSTCNLPSAIITDVALLVMPFGIESYEGDPLAKLATLHSCESCHTIFEMPDVPTLIDNREK